MASSEISSSKSQNGLQRIGWSLARAVLEWLMMCMLLIISVLSYIIRKFAHTYELQSPCLLCSNLDHVLGNATLRFRWDLICNNHKLEMSSLVLCHAHTKLVDVQQICGSCLISFPAIIKSNSKACRLLLFRNHVPSLGCCVCCNDSATTDRSNRSSVHSNLLTSEDAGFDDTCLGALVHDQRLQSTNKVMLDRPTNQGAVSDSPFTHFGYTELKINSESESATVFSDEEDDDDVAEVDTLDQVAQPGACDPVLDPSFSISPTKLNLVDSGDLLSVVATLPLAVGVGEHGWKQFDGYVSQGFGCLDDVSFSPIVGESPAEELDNISPPSDSEGACGAAPTTSGAISSIRVAPASPHAKMSSAEQLEGKQLDVSFHLVDIEENHPQVPNQGSFVDVDLVCEATSVSGDGGRHPSKLLDESKPSSMLGFGNVKRKLSGMLAEQHANNESSSTNEKSKVLDSHPSLVREFATHDMSPRVGISPRFSANLKFPMGNDEQVIIDAPGTSSMGMLQKKVSLERNESGISLDSSIFGEIESENKADRLKQKNEHYRKSLNALYEELEEERNASAIAANQAMAMITRLQEEKAALNMDALQSLRLMEEQAEYDMEALQKLSDLLADKKKEVDDLKDELEFYRNNFVDDSMLLVPAAQGSQTKMASFADHSVTCRPVDHTSGFEENGFLVEDDRGDVNGSY